MRCEVLTSLALDILEEERNAENLLRMFDIELADAQDRHPSLPPTLVKPWIPSGPHNLETGGKLARSYENPFLSTPLRLKHFSRLSPTALRELLRSPSIREETPDHSYSSDLVLEQEHPLPDEHGETKWLDPHCNSSLFADYDSRAFPPTPPSTVRLPALDRFPLGQGAVPFTRVQPSSEDSVPSNAFSVQAPGVSDGHYTQSDRTSSSPDSCLCPLPRRCLVQHTNTLMSSSALRNFRRVINELQGIEHNPDKRRRTLVSSLRMSVLTFPRGSPVEDIEDIPAASSSCLLAAQSSMRPLLISGGQRSVERRIWSTPLCASLTPLDEEFVGLLLQRAAEEEADANQLRVLAGKLERLAGARRNLAGLI